MKIKELVSEKTMITHGDTINAERNIVAFLTSIEEALTKEEKVEIPLFGTFKKELSKDRYDVTFIASKELGFY